MVDVARCKEMCTSPAQLATGRCAGSTDCAARLRTLVTFEMKSLNYMMFFCDGDFVISA
jgi:hypothetical protein